jgi:hypothetical protein
LTLPFCQLAFFGRKIRRELSDAIGSFPVEPLDPVPPGNFRLIERGSNGSGKLFEQKLARSLAQRTGLESRQDVAPIVAEMLVFDLSSALEGVQNRALRFSTQPLDDTRLRFGRQNEEFRLASRHQFGKLPPGLLFQPVKSFVTMVLLGVIGRHGDSHSLQYRFLVRRLMPAVAWRNL